jgi:hypothetical protein
VLTVTNSTISANLRSFGYNSAGGIWTSGTATIAHSTIADNQPSAEGFVGGVVNAGGTLTIRNSIIAGSRVSGSPYPMDINGSFVSEGYNLVGSTLNSEFLQDTDQYGTPSTPLDPVLDPLANYGNSTPIHRLQATSPALDKGNSFGVSIDQTGGPRPVDLPRANATGGNGADIGAWEAQVVPPPVVLSAVSRKSHGDSGTFDITLPLYDGPAVECRAAGIGQRHQVMVTFANPVSVASASVVSDDGMATVNTVTSGTRVSLELVSVANAQTVGITLTGVNDGTTTGDIFIPVSFLLGDTNGSGTVTASDIGSVKSQSGQAVTVANFRTDVTANGGSINASDIGQVKAQSGTQLP